MARFRRFRRSYGSKGKRNSERIVRAASSSVNANTQQTAYTYTATQACTVKSIKLDVGITAVIGGLTADGSNLPYALVVVREGYEANALNYPALTDDLYNPTMDVLMSGVITSSGVEDHKFNMIGRKLKRGDRLCLIVTYRPTDVSTAAIVSFEMNFSILT